VRQGIKPAVAEVGADQGVVVFLDKTVVVFLVRAAAREMQVRQIILKIVQQEVVEETCGDGNQWVRHSFDRMEIPQEFILDRFHLRRAARRTFHDKAEAKQIVTQICEKGFSSVSKELRQRIEQSEGRERQKLEDFYCYIHNNQDGLLDLEHRGVDLPAYLGGIEGNVDKLVVHRMKGRGCSWRLRGLRAMLALCRNCEELKQHSYQYLPLSIPNRSIHRVQKLDVEYSEVVPKPMPILYGPDHDKPWVNTLRRIVHGRHSLFHNLWEFDTVTVHYTISVKWWFPCRSSGRFLGAYAPGD